MSLVYIKGLPPAHAADVAGRAFSRPHSCPAHNACSHSAPTTKPSSDKTSSTKVSNGKTRPHGIVRPGKLNRPTSLSQYQDAVHLCPNIKDMYISVPISRLCTSRSQYQDAVHLCPNIKMMYISVPISRFCTSRSQYQDAVYLCPNVKML